MTLQLRDRARPVAPRAAPHRRLRAGTASVLLIVQLVGCYRYVPVSTARAGTQVAVGVTDRGRVALEEPVGPGVRRIEGDLLNQSDSSVVLSVRSVQYYDLAVPARWQGERLEISRDHVAELRERRLSRTRTWLAVGLAVVGAIGVALVSISGFGGDSGSDRPPGGNGETQ